MRNSWCIARMRRLDAPVPRWAESDQVTVCICESRCALMTCLQRRLNPRSQRSVRFWCMGNLWWLEAWRSGVLWYWLKQSSPFKRSAQHSVDEEKSCITWVTALGAGHTGHMTARMWERIFLRISTHWGLDGWGLGWLGSGWSSAFGWRPIRTRVWICRRRRDGLEPSGKEFYTKDNKKQVSFFLSCVVFNQVV